LSFIYSLINFLFFNNRLTDRSDSITAMFTDDTVSAGSMAFTPLAADTVPSAPMTMADQMHAQIDSLQKIDPDFNEVAFLSSAATAYTKAIQAEGAMSADSATDVVTQAYHDRLAARVADWQAQGYTRVVTGLNVDGAKLFKVSIDGASESLTVRITGTGVRCTKDISSGVVAEGSITSQTFTEYATFVRPAGTVTPKTTALGGAAHCPSCGAPAPATATVCPFCGTPLTPGGAPWLLDRVSQSAYA
jgi:predicted lipid-binding transport protein (Tim44 family)